VEGINVLDADTNPLPDIDVEGLNHVVIEVDDLEAARVFYTDGLGFVESGQARWPGIDGGVVLNCAKDQHLVLVAGKNPIDLKDTGVHFAFRVGLEARKKIAASLGHQGIETFTYKEDNPCEEANPFYFFDPFGNRVQLVVGQDIDGFVPALDHVAVQVGDIQWGEIFYGRVLGLSAAHRVGWATADYIRAKDWADGKEDMAPGTRRLDKRYSSMVNQKVLPRVNMQVYFDAGDSTLGLYLSNQHTQESPEFEKLGTPRVAFRVSQRGLAAVCDRLRAENWRFYGPVEHSDTDLISASVYCRDPGGNFIELVSNNT
jgi:catechol 2,3-dioxygenase-like lactoylglutathione lyase family enzyme